LGNSANFTIPGCFAFIAKKAKKGEEMRWKSAPCQHSKIGGKMKRRDTKRKEKQSCDIARLLDTIERAASAAKQIYRAAEPVIKRVLKSGTKTK
jgi:hypothetical protein